ncbi:hypothetical protein F2Q69_00036591 [Brassica cretica]|uniref:Uncharacterized protein n=1 Tax=Brassica cretica TaxID=69181 RepID=A0A8S9SP65_BRACR|nr:hypothetical protein F2Q69_00036591 [Brassica cretica]
MPLSTLTSGEGPPPPDPPHPPDPPDHESPLALTDFPSLKNSNPHQKLKSKSLNPRLLASPPLTTATPSNSAVNLTSPDTFMVDSETTTPSPVGTGFSTKSLPPKE